MYFRKNICNKKCIIIEKLTYNNTFCITTMQTTDIKEENKPKSHGKNSFQSGKKYQNKIYVLLSKIQIDGKTYDVKEVDRAKSGPDITINHPKGMIGIEIKNKGAFEGGAKKLVYKDNGYTFAEDSIHKYILGDNILYDKKKLPWDDKKRTLKDWTECKSIFKNDIYIDADKDVISIYYKNVGTYYIQIEGHGLYHTGEDILELGVPYFSCEIKLRIRSTKHMKNNIATDITGALQFNKRTLDKSPYSLDDVLPSSMVMVEE